MKNNRFLSLALCALFAFVPFSVDALVFKNGEDVISLSERDISCVKERLTDGFRNVGSLEDNFVFTDNYEEDYVKVTVEGKCESLTLEEIYEDDDFTYYLSCIKSKYIEVRYSNGKKENIKEALLKKKININDLDKFDISYLKYDKSFNE